ncbi:hypothetical protein PRUPE_8G151400 [Prunus persica]|uniref:Uncharacterized protein n=1 Tax=Prunus persica TaxID=3760 RepID=A0A251MY85_PRUPE|nr:hypothetical protein PRUPE_8G151400 [Prunus persica]
MREFICEPDLVLGSERRQPWLTSSNSRTRSLLRSIAERIGRESSLLVSHFSSKLSLLMLAFTFASDLFNCRQ